MVTTIRIGSARVRVSYIPLNVFLLDYKVSEQILYMGAYLLNKSYWEISTAPQPVRETGRNPRPRGHPLLWVADTQTNFPGAGFCDP